MNIISKPTVLVVDDSQDDLVLVRMAVRKLRLAIDLRTAEGGEEAIAYLSGAGKYSDRQIFPLPRLVILDLKMPRVNGMDVLAALRKMDLPQNPSVVILSSSRLPQDMQQALALGAVAFHTKPADIVQFHELLERLISFYAYTAPGGAQRRAFSSAAAAS